METPLKRTWAEIDLDALAYNFKQIRNRIGPTPGMLGVVKADAYGHGAIRVARKLEELNASYLAVSNADEAVELRDGGVRLPILILGYTPSDQTERLLAHDITQAVPNLEIARAYDAAAALVGRRLKVHLKLDTGMGRLGLPCDNGQFDASLHEVREILALSHLDVEGVFTHFAAADEDDADSAAFTRLQHERFARMVDAARAAGAHFRLVHCCNAGGIASYPEWAGDMVRCGILLYGTGELAQRMGLRPVMSLKTVVSTVKDFAPDMPVSYGRTFYTRRRSRIAVLPVGYADGLHRSLSGKLVVHTPCGDAPQVGRICMDMCMIDATDLPQLQPGDEVEIFGTHALCETAARACGTISYELLCAVSKRVPRIYLDNGARS